MNNQGAGFAFDPNMDFSAFTMPLQQQQTFMKPVEDNTSSFFGDEGIDTSASFFDPAMFSTPPTSFDMQQSFTMDDTTGSTTAWNTQLTPELHSALSTFPSTPAQSFDALYQHPTALGKRSLQLDVHDFPQAKRHETADFTLFSPYPSTTTSSSWPLESQSTTGSMELGLSDEAADMCATWFNKYNVLPSDKHIDSLSQLTGESAEAVRSWFGRLLKQGMGGNQGDSAYKSQTSLLQQQRDSFRSNQYSTDIIQTSPSQLPSLAEETTSSDILSGHDATTVSQPTNPLRGSRKRCTPTEDRQLLGRDPNKIYQCTRKCGKRYGRKCDWKRNEEEGYPCKSWVCSLCKSQGVENVKPCYRKYHFVQHFRNIHPDINADDYDATSTVSSETEFPRQCGFCRHRFESRQERIDHIADHFKQGKCMLDWNDEGSDDGHGSDNNDDDDDRPSGDGFDSNKDFSQSPQQDPRDGSFENHGGAGGGASGGQAPAGRCFQFQLTQRGQDGKQHIHPTSGLQQCQTHGDNQHEQESILCSTEDASCDSIRQSIQEATQSSRRSSVGDSISSQVPPLPKQYVPTTTDDENAMAGDALSRSIVEELQILSQTSDLDIPWLSNASSPTPENGADGYAQSESLKPSIPQGDESLQIQSTKPLPQANAVEDVLSARLREAKSPDALLEQKSLQSIPVTTQSFLSVKFLGTGGFSTVDEVVHRDTNLRMGRKTLKNRDQSALEEIRKEVEVLQKLRHPHVIRFLGAYANGDKMSILVSPVADTTLGLWLDRFTDHKPANLAETVVKMFGCLASSVRYLHEQRPVVKHMDIKPQNILIVGGDQKFPHVVLCDFGISSSDEMPDGQAKPVTRQYIAPEVSEGLARKQAADIWSLGCVFAEMASVPFSKDNTQWLSFRKAFNGRTGKYYWQDVPGLQRRLSGFLDRADTGTEQTVVRALKSMLSADPAVRPNAAALTMIFSPAPCCLDWPNDKAIFPGPNEELGAVEMLVREGSVDCCTQLHQCESSSDDAPLSRAKCWLDDCSHTHDACRQQMSSGTKALPTRLIDLLPDGQATSYVRVIDSASIQPTSDEVDYIALSHAWNENHVTLTSDWLQDKSTELPLQSLPSAVNTAISTAQQLGHRYIWADSLCVLQDSDHDKQQECATMATVFRNATLTVVLDQMAAEKAQVDDVLSTIDHADLQRHEKCSSSTHDRQHASTTLSAIDFATPGFAWDTRAWALQERLLSRRFLHLGEQMYWECNSLKASETFPRGLSPLVWEKVHSKSSTNAKTHITPHRSSSSASESRRQRPNAICLRNGLLVAKDSDNISATRVEVLGGITGPLSSLTQGQSYTEPPSTLAHTIGKTITTRLNATNNANTHPNIIALHATNALSEHSKINRGSSLSSSRNRDRERHSHRSMTNAYASANGKFASNGKNASDKGCS